MAARTFRKRHRYFFAVEGESEQSLVRWVQMLSEGSLSVHLDSYPLGGGGFKSMVEEAVREHAKQARSKGGYRDRFLIVDADRAADRRDWSLDKLREEAAKHKLVVIVQRPKHEGLLYRMVPGKERDIPSASMAETKLRTFWPTYEKPANANMLSAHYTLADLLRVARVDSDIETFLTRIGLLQNP